MSQLLGVLPMKTLFASIITVITSLFNCFLILVDIVSSVFRSAQNVQDVVEDASLTFKITEKLENADKIKQLKAQLADKDIQL